MMRSMFSGVSSLRVHQTRMDVIANNIANVNTTGFKGQRALFADAFYQNLQGASGPMLSPPRAGTNPMQVGLGLNLASIDNLMHQGISQRTDQATDVAIQGRGFFIVRDPSGANFFTRAGNIRRDSHWNLHINGNQLMGWSTIPCNDTMGGHAVNRGLLVPLSLTGQKQNMPAEATTRINMLGNLNITQLNRNVATEEEYTFTTMRFYDSLGNRYEVDVRMVFHRELSEAPGSPGGYWTMEFLTGYLGPNGEWLRPGDTGAPTRGADGSLPDGWSYGVRAFLEGNRTNPDNRTLIGMCFFGGLNGEPGSPSDFAAVMNTRVTVGFDSNGYMRGIGRVDADGNPIRFEYSTRADNLADLVATGSTNTWLRGNMFDTIRIVPIAGVAPSATFGDVSAGGLLSSDYSPGPPPAGTPPQDAVRIAIGSLELNFERLLQMGRENTSLTTEPVNGGGPGVLDAISIGGDGVIWARYSNGRQRIVGQIPLAMFANPEGLERVGNNLWVASANSGPFDGTGQIGTMQGGALEGSNVDLAEEFTQMITTQRGFQAASRTITVSDEMLQELVNLRR